MDTTSEGGTNVKGAPSQRGLRAHTAEQHGLTYGPQSDSLIAREHSSRRKAQRLCLKHLQLNSKDRPPNGMSQPSADGMVHNNPVRVGRCYRRRQAHAALHTDSMRDRQRAWLVDRDDLVFTSE